MTAALGVISYIGLIASTVGAFALLVHAFHTLRTWDVAWATLITTLTLVCAISAGSTQ